MPRPRCARSESLDETLDLLGRETEARYPGAMCSVLLGDHTEQVLRHAAGPSLPESFKQSIDGLAMEKGVGRPVPADLLQRDAMMH